MLFALTATFGVVMATQAQANTYHPNRLDDPAPNGCQRNDCSLREAVIAANDHPGEDSIVMRAGKRYEITRAASGNDVQVGGLKVNGPLSVSSGGPGHSTVDLNGLDAGDGGFDSSSGLDGGFDSSDGEADLSLRGINIVNAITAVRVVGGAQRLTLADCRIYGDATAYGVVGQGSTVVRDSTFGPFGDATVLPPGAFSAGLLSFGEFSKLRVSNTRFEKSGTYGITAAPEGQPTTLSHVKVTGSDYAISLQGSAAATVDHVNASNGAGYGLNVSSDFPLVLRDSSFENFALGGAAKYGAAGNVVVSRSRFARNGYSGLTIVGGGDKISISRVSGVNNWRAPGLVVFGEFRKTSIAQSTFSGNRYPTSGVGGGAGVNVAGQLEVSNSTFSGNRAAQGGGAMLFSKARMNITNSTFANNRADDDGGGLVAAAGGGVLRSVTIAGNLAGADDSGSNLGGGLVMIAPEAELKMFNSVMALNKVGAGSFVPNCLASFTLARNNVRGSSDKQACLGFTQAQGNRIIKNPKLGKLGDNGGLTKTMCPKAGSPLIDKAVRAPRRDQRGRKRQGKADIGACESKKIGRHRRPGRKTAARNSSTAPLDHLDPAFDISNAEVDIGEWILSHDVRPPGSTEIQTSVLPRALGTLVGPESRHFGAGGDAGASVP
jgi:hypothetical protein